MRRGLYCGSIGYIGFNGSMRTNIAIRTMTLTKNNLLKKECIINYNIVDVKYAYPIIYKDTEIRIKKIFSYFQEFENLYLIGRNADFEYLHTHHIIDRSEKLVNRMVS